MTGVNGTIALLQNLASTVTGIRYAPQVGYPSSLDTAKLPAVITFASSATATPISNRVTPTSTSFRKIQRDYLLACFVDVLGQATSRIRMDLTIELLDAMSNLIVPNRHLADNVRILQTQDSGVMTGADIAYGNADNLVYNGQPYTGFVMTITVIELTV